MSAEYEAPLVSPVSGTDFAPALVTANCVPVEMIVAAEAADPPIRASAYMMREPEPLTASIVAPALAVVLPVAEPVGEVRTGAPAGS